MDHLSPNKVADALLTLTEVSRAGELARHHHHDTTLAETGAALLLAPFVVVFLRRSDGSMVKGCDVGVVGDRRLVRCARDLARAAFDAGEPVFLWNVRLQSSSIAKRLANLSVESVVCVPHISDNGVDSAAVVVMTNEHRAFTRSDIELIRVLAAQASANFPRFEQLHETSDSSSHRDPLVQLAHRKIRELSAVNQVGEAVSSTLDMDQLFEIALDQCMVAVGADVGSLMVLKEHSNKLEIVSSRGLAAKFAEETFLPVGRSISGWVARNGTSVLVSDARTDSRFEMQSYRDDINSAASVPLITSSKVIGVLNVNTTREGRFYDDRDLQLLETIANQVAVAIENARLYARLNMRTSQLDSLLQVSKTITATLRLDDVISRLSAQIRRVFQMEVCVILLVDNLSGRFRFAHGSGLKLKHHHGYMDAALPLASHVKRTNRAVIVADIKRSCVFSTSLSETEGLVSAVSIPLLNEGKIVAVATGFSRRHKAFPDSARKMMKPLSELAGVAVHNAWAYRQKYRLAEMMRRRFAPACVPEVSSFDLGLKLLPAREVGGDYCDFVVGEDGMLTLVLGDVAGSDVEAAECALTARHVIRAYSKMIADPAATLARANIHLYEETDAEAFVSVFMGRLDSSSRTITYSCAGCEPALVYCARDGSTSTLHCSGILLGITPSAEFVQETLQLESGDVVAIFSDGVTEAGSRNDMLGCTRVAKMLREYAGKTAQEIADSISSAVIEFAGGFVMDDVTIIIVKVL